MLRTQVLAALAEALAALAESRRREGAALREVLLAQCEQIDHVAAQVQARAPDLLASVERKLRSGWKRHWARRSPMRRTDA